MLDRHRHALLSGLLVALAAPMFAASVVVPPGMPLPNGGFESGPAMWGQYSEHGWPLILSTGFPGDLTPNSGSWAAWLGGDYDDLSLIYQELTLPAWHPVLGYARFIASQDLCGFDYARVLVDAVVVHELTLCDATSGWQWTILDLAAFAGQSVMLEVRVETDATLNSNYFLDDFQFLLTPIFGDDFESGDICNWSVPCGPP